MKKVIVGLTALSLVLSGRSSGSVTSTPKKTEGVPWDEIGLKAEADYHGDGLMVKPITKSARLHCVFQRLDAEATPEGLWLTSTVTNQVSDRFEVKAVMLTRPGGGQSISTGLRLSESGELSMKGQTVRLSRPGLVEEYGVSMDGMRQDFVVTEKPEGSGELEVRLTVVGARVEAMPGGAKLVLEQSGRNIAYSRIRATDATGRELPARIEVQTKPGSSLAVVVVDTSAVYPVRIDPTFSDANWLSMGFGMNHDVNALAVSGSTVYAGGTFSTTDSNTAFNVAQWNGSSWSSVGLGIDGAVFAMALSSNNLYVGGNFTTATNADSSTVSVNNIAQWNGTNWSALGLGLGGAVYAIALSGGTLYAGGGFTVADGNEANYIAQWDGTEWSPLGLGMGYEVDALAASGSKLYAGGKFTTAGGNTANYIAEWDGTNWSPLGSGMGGSVFYPWVFALAVSNNTVYAGGSFTTAGSNVANRIAQWDGTNWSALGSGMNDSVFALTVSGSTLYAGGGFNTNRDDPQTGNFIAQWNGTNWSALGSGVNDIVRSLAVSGDVLYAGGLFTMAGRKGARYAAESVLVSPEFSAPPLANHDGTITLNVSTATNISSRLYSTTNISPPVLWQAIDTNLTGGIWQFQDTNAADFNEKFYQLSTP